VECGGCARFLKFAPQVEPFVSLADQAASETAVLDALCLCDDLKIDLRSDGRTVDFASAKDRQRAPRRLRDLVRQCSHTLAVLIGSNL
jgi:hypothetical protein